MKLNEEIRLDIEMQLNEKMRWGILDILVLSALVIFCSAFWGLVRYIVGAEIFWSSMIVIVVVLFAYGISFDVRRYLRKGKGKVC